MTLVATSIRGLGTPTADAQIGLLDLGEDRLRLRWNSTKSLWISDPRTTITLRSGWILWANNGLGWSYLNNPSGGRGQLGQQSFSWNPRPIRRADLAFTAGLQLQEHLITDFWTFDPGVIYNLATVLYPFSDGDQIDGSVTPTNHFGLQVNSTPTRRIFASSGWQTSGVQSTGGKPDLAPHLYTQRIATQSDSVLEFILARHRWVAAI